MGQDDLDDDEAELLGEIRARRKQIVQSHRQKKSLHGGNSVMPRSKHHTNTITDMQAGLESLGMDAGAAVTRARSASAARTGRKRERSIAAGSRGAVAAAAGAVGDSAMAGTDEAPAKRLHSSRSRSLSRGALCSVHMPACE